MELVRQQDEYDCGVANCVMIINHFSKAKLTIEEFKIAHKYNREEYSLDNIKNLLVNYQIDIDFFEIESVNKLAEANNYPILLVIKNNEGFNHYIIVNDFDNGYFEIYDPNFKTKKKYSIKQLAQTSLNIVGFIKKNNHKEEAKLATAFNKKYWCRFSSLFKDGWKQIVLINILSMLSLFTFFFGNMFIKVLLTEYSYLTFKRAILIVLMFIGIITLWALMLYVQQKISKVNNQRIIHRYLTKLDKKYDLLSAHASFSTNQQLEEIYNLIRVLKYQIYLLNNFFGYALFSGIVIYLTAHISAVLLIGTLLLIMCLFLLKIWQVKKIIIMINCQK